MTKRNGFAAEGRAIAARPSLCLLVLVALCACAVVAAPASAATNGQLVLTGTTPPSSASSPAESTTPRIRGGESGIIISVLRPRALRPVRTAAWGEAGNTVTIYTDSKCEGTPVATGTFEELKGTGIQVEVEEDSTTTFYASQTDSEDPLETSPCSTPGLTYYQGEAVEPPGEEEEPPPGGGGEEPPAGGGSGGGSSDPGVSPAAPVAPRIHMEPSGRANLNTPRVAGSAAGAERVRIFASAHCNGSPVVEASGAELTAGVAVRVPDNSETAFSALSLAGEAKSECSQAVTYVEDSIAPRTRITMAPGSKTRRRKAVFRFADVSGDPTGTKFECKLDRRKWRACYSPFKVKGLGYSRHTIKIRATDAVGNAEAKAVKRSFKVVKR
jgi:hypothetical protein